MKKIYTSILAITISCGAFAQTQLENQGFETWDNVSSDNREPQEWSSIKTGAGNASQPSGFVVDRSTVVRPGTSGTYSAVVETKTLTVFGFINVDVNGILTNGQVDAPTTSAADGFNKTVPSNGDFNTAFADMPDTLVAWVNYQPVGNDNGRIQCILHDVVGAGTAAGSMGTLPVVGNSQGDNTAQVIATAEQDLASNTNGWERVAIPFSYVNGNTPEYILVTATSSVVAGGGDHGSKLYVDDFSLRYNITPVLSANAVDVSIFMAGALDVDYSTGGTPTSATDFVAELSDENGSFAAPTVIGTASGTTMASGTISCSIPMGTVAGTGYMVRVTNASEHYASVAVPLTITNLTVGVADVASENIRVFNSNGNVVVDLSSSYLENPSFELISLSGQRVQEGSLILGAVNSVSSIRAGVYLIRVSHSSGVHTTKVYVN